jgi:hypothetical protein
MLSNFESRFSVLLSLTKKKEVFMQSTDITWTPSVTF